MKEKRLTNESGAIIPEDNHSISIGPRGPLTLNNIHLFEKLAHFNRERIPERVVHARGTGAHGHFILEKGLSKYTLAHFLQDDQIGKKTPIFARFSTVGGGQDSSDYARDPRGFAVKFYTEEGNWDMVGNNTPVFFIRDPAKFPDFIHSQKKDPKSNIPNPAKIYEFWANYPASMHQITILMSDRGIPQSYRNMNGYSSHALSFWNAKGERFWVKWHFKTDQGVKNFTNAEAKRQDPFGNQKDLVDAIENKNYPSWSVKIQIMPEMEAEKMSFNPFDLTKVWPHKDYPLITIGKMILDENVSNYFAETEQAAFSPGNLVPGIGISPDRVLQARVITYADAHRYRLGTNFNQIPVNSPKCPVHHYERDGKMAGMHKEENSYANQDSSTNFYPNDGLENNPTIDPKYKEPPLKISETTMDYYDNLEDDNFSQAGKLYNIMSEDQKNQLASNIAEGLVTATPAVQERMLSQFRMVDKDYAHRIIQYMKKYKH
ncbi:MAG: catalase [Bacteroidales bacterium]